MPLDYDTYMRSATWRERSLTAKVRARWKCAVCGWDYKKWDVPLDAHHPDYSRLGNEGYGDLVCLCRRHHPKGAFSREYIRMWRTSYRWRKRIAWLFRVIVRVAKWFVRRAGERVRAQARTR